MSGIRRIGKPEARDSEDVSPDEILVYVDNRLNQEAAADQQARGMGPSLPGERERNIAITNLQTAMLWLKESRVTQGKR